VDRIAMKLSVFFTALVLIFLLAVTAEAVKGDKRESKTFSLENGLDILLISDPDVHRSAAALSVGVGHLHDPVEKQGLAHYLEHMLFLGTKKYPEVGSFKKFLDEHSGGSNAYTGGAITNYFFQISQKSPHQPFRENMQHRNRVLSCQLMHFYGSKQQEHFPGSTYQAMPYRN